MAELLPFVGIILIVAVGAVSLHLLVGLMMHGTDRIREVREEGGGVTAKSQGELCGGQGKPSSARAHGLHMSVQGGRLRYREKSVIATRL